MEPFRYGVFQVGQAWMVTDDSGMRIGFPARGAAMAALAAVVAGHRATGRPVMVTVQEEGGRLKTLLNPPYHLLLTPIANDVAWDARISLPLAEIANDA